MGLRRTGRFITTATVLRALGGYIPLGSMRQSLWYVGFQSDNGNLVILVWLTSDSLSWGSTLGTLPVMGDRVRQIQTYCIL